ncbi:MAG: hypothetical protein ACE5H0_02085 [Bacteroidota bacterium]
MGTLVRKTWKVIAVFVLVIAADRAMSGGSGYSRYGIGDVRYVPNARAFGMGGVSFAVLGTAEVNRFNPATWTNLKRTTFSGTFFYEGFSTTDGVNSAYFGSGEFGGAILAVPIAPSRGIVFAGGFSPYSTVNYDIAAIVTNSGQSGIEYDLRYTGSGGLSTALLGLSYAPTSNLHLGLQTQYLFGTIENFWRFKFLSSSFSDSETRRTTEFRGFQFTFGVIHSGIGSWIGLSDHHRLSLGALITAPADLTAERQRLLIRDSRTDTLTLAEGTAFIPARFGLGAAITIDSRYLIGTDVSYQNWKRYEEFGIHPIELRNSLRWSVGAERLPARQRASFGDRIAYRLGFTYNATYYQVKNKSLDEIFISGGIGFPLGPETGINLAVEYGLRGTTENQLQRDNILHFIVTVNVGELWFVRAPEE